MGIVDGVSVDFVDRTKDGDLLGVLVVMEYVTRLGPGG